MQNDPDNTAAVEEAWLLARCGRGDREAFRSVYARYAAPLYALALRIVGDAGEAEEVLQDAFVKIWQNAASYDSRKSRPFTWAVTVTRRTSIDHLRRRRRSPATTPLSEDAETLPGSAVPTGRQAAEASDLSEHLLELLADVPSGQRQALELALFSELTQAEIGRRLGQPVGTVKSWIRRGLAALRTTLTESSQ